MTDALNELHIYMYNLSFFKFPIDDDIHQGLAIGGAVVNSALFNVDGGHRAVIFDRLPSNRCRLYKVLMINLQVCRCEEGGGGRGHSFHDPMGPEADHL